MSYVNPKEASEILGVSIQTLRRWAKQGKIQYITTKGKHRRYKIKVTEEIDRKKSGYWIHHRDRYCKTWLQ